MPTDFYKPIEITINITYDENVLAGIYDSLGILWIGDVFVSPDYRVDWIARERRLDEIAVRTGRIGR